MLHSKVPLVNFSIAGIACVQVTAVIKSPIGQLPVGSSLWWRQSCREWILESRVLRRKVVGREIEGRIFREGGPRVLEVGSHVHAIEDSRPAANDCVRSQLVGKSQARREVVPIHPRVAMSGG